jgi:hypothetical protein
MFQQLVVLFLIGLGVKTPVLPGTVMGDQTENHPTAAVSGTPGVLRGDLRTIHTDTQQIHTDRQTVKTDIGDRNKASAGADIRTLHGDLGKRQQDVKTFVNDFRPKEASGDSAARENFLASRKEIETKFFHEIESKRASASAAFKKERDAFKARLAIIKDTAKQTKLQNLDTLLSQVNTNRTTAMTNHLNQMDQILAKISAGLTTLSTGGTDVTQAQSAVDAAATAISVAKAAVAAQAGKEYVIGITSENNLGNDVGRTRSQLASDLQAVEATITQARKAVAAAIRAYAQLKGETAPVQ